MTGRYTLSGHDPVPEPDLLTWAEWFEAADRTVKKTVLDDCKISTVFLGLDHQWGDGPPLLFETMVFGGDFDDEQDRYSTWDEADAGHDAIVARVSADSKPQP